MAKQQVLVIGLGQFGMALARAMSAAGEEVLAVDRREDRVQIAASFAAEAIALDAMDETEFSRLRPSHRDLCVCAIGDEAREASILVTAMMRQMGAKRVVARATTELHARILRLVGAHEVINPEKLLGERLAARLSAKGVLDLVPLGEHLVIAELEAPPRVRGRTLSELQLPDKAEITVLAVRRMDAGAETIQLPSASMQLRAGDVLVVVGPTGAARRFAEGD